MVKSRAGQGRAGQGRAGQGFISVSHYVMLGLPYIMSIHYFVI